jgi:hypothetical protein
VRVIAANEFGQVVTTSDRTAVVTSVAAPVVVATTMVASASDVTCCAAVKLIGTVSTAKAGETVTIMALTFGDLAAAPIGTTTTGEGGAWSFAVRPAIETTYFAKTRSATTPGITIAVHPRVGLGYAGGVFSTKVTAATSFAGHYVYLQRYTLFRQWVTIRRLVLGPRSGRLFSLASVRAIVPRGRWSIRVLMPPDQVGPGYVQTQSGTQPVIRRR